MTSWNPSQPQWSPEEKALFPSTISTAEPISLSTILRKSDLFPIPFPISTTRCKNLQKTVPLDILERNINSVYPIVHEKVLHIYAKYILQKRKDGNTMEKEVYRNMNLVDFVNRLLSKRAACFYGKSDKYSLLNGRSGRGKWEIIGTEREKPPLILKHCLSYEEIKLSAFLSVSSYSCFINSGSRKNSGIISDDRSSIEPEGIIIGVIGPRLVKDGVMDFQELVITKRQNSNNVLSNLYEERLPLYSEVETSKDKRYQKLKPEEYFDISLYKKRLLFTIDTLLAEANHRAAMRNTTAYIHVVGAGLGLWRRTPLQDQWFVDTFMERLGLQFLKISDVCFSYIPVEACLGYNNGEVTKNGVKVHISKREPHSKLGTEHQGKLLVVSYAWDGNALPGNEFWDGKVASSGDSAAASSTQVAELHNTYINQMVCGNNLRVVKTDGKVVDLATYLKLHIFNKQ